MLALYIICGIIVFLILAFIVFYLIINYKLFYKFFGRQTEKDIKNSLQDNAFDHARDKMVSASSRVKKLPHEEICIFSYDGLKLFANYYKNSGDSTVILFHGMHTVALDTFSYLIEKLLKRGYNVLLVDERANGRSEGNYITYGIKEQYDVLSWIDWVDGKTRAKNIFLHGISLGATAVGFASDKIKCKKVKGIVFDSGFTSVQELHQHYIGRYHLPKSLFGLYFHLIDKKIGIDYSKSVTDSLSITKIPMLFIWGKKDEIVPFDLFMHCFKECSSNKRSLIVDRAHHGLSLIVGGREVRSHYYAFFNEFKEE